MEDGQIYLPVIGEINKSEVIFVFIYTFIMLIPSIVIGWNNLSFLHMFFSKVSNAQPAIGDAQVIIENSLMISENIFNIEWSSIGGGGPLRYFYLVPVYLLTKPSPETAIQIGNTFTAIIYFSILPVLFSLYIYRISGRIAGLLTVLIISVHGSGLLSIIPWIPKQLLVLGMGQYHTGLWQQIFPLPQAIFLLFIICNLCEINNKTTVHSVLGGFLLGTVGATQYAIGFLMAIITGTSLINNEKINNLFIIGIVSSLFIPFILIVPSSNSQAINNINRLYDLGIHYDVKSLALIIYVVAVIFLIYYYELVLSESRVFEISLVVSAVIFFLYPEYISQRIRGMMIMFVIGSFAILTSELLKNKLNLIKRLDNCYLNPKHIISLAILLSGSISIILILSVLL